MREIEFRGKDLYTGELVYGYLIPGEGKHGQWQIVDDEGVTHIIEPTSASEFVGCDRQGERVYECDKVTNRRDGTVFEARMNHIYTIKDYVKIGKGRG